MSQLTVEQYLESIGSLEDRESPVSTTAIAQIMGVSPASVSEMLRRLDKKGLVTYTPYSGATLTDEGRQRFLRLTRRHRLWEVFLHRHLDIGWEDVYEHACNLEHATSDLVVDKLAEFLDNPDVCPHGSPIPGANLKPRITSGIILADLQTGQSARILRIMTESDPEFLRHLESLGLKLGTTVAVLEKSPFDGTMTVKVDDNTRAVGKEVASLIMTEPL